ncbi:MAG: hypothetical protein FWG10_13215 [Eubacteriaceae bacterium]|nr:hypothetical protein [Eubacteriaceae bacterium]
MRKTIVTLAIVALLLMTLPLTAFASHGSSHHGGTQTLKHTLCNVKTCKKTGLHTHNGRIYRAHYIGDGHSYHKAKH